MLPMLAAVSSSLGGVYEYEQHNEHALHLDPPLEVSRGQSPDDPQICPE